MVLLIGGHPRSGTTLLRNLCNGHLEMTVTNELGNFSVLGQPYWVYGYSILKRWWNVQGKWAFDSSYSQKQRKSLWNFVLVTRYLLRLYRHPLGSVGVPEIETALHNIFPKARIVGDKTPSYVDRLDKLIDTDGLLVVVIYRDPRDVVSSTLTQVRTVWRNMPFTKKLDTADKVARRWVQEIESMERHKGRIHVIRYEDLINHPEQELETLGRYLTVDPSGFPKKTIKGSYIGKYKIVLTREEIAAVMEIAGPTMARLGYV